MKFRLLFLGMVAAAFMVSCNNEIDGPSVDSNGSDGKFKIVESTGKQTYLAMGIEGASTYAGVGTLAGTADERQVQNVAVFIYKMDVSQNTFPENYAFLTTSPTHVMLKTTDGTKKVYVALNVGTTTTFFGTNLSTTTTTVDEGDVYGVAFTTLNATLWADPTTGYTLTTPTGVSTANGLIRAFAGGTSTYAQGLLANNSGTPSGTNTRYYLMSNWDNSVLDTILGGSGTYKSTCLFTLDPDIPKDQLLKGGATTAHPKNTLKIFVQRAVAKTTFKFSPAIQDATESWTYVSDGNEGDKGKFTPWGATSATAKGLFSVGNINKESTVFQKFTGGSVSDDNYGFINANPTATGGNTNWYVNFDNTRVFGANTNYFTTANTVSVVKTNMQLANNGFNLVTDSVYITENAQEYAAAYQDNSTYVVVGGVYKPQWWISEIEQAAVKTNDPVVAYNGISIPSGTASGSVLQGTAYAPIGWGAGSLDTVYYHSGWKLFLHGRNNVEKYYAWVKTNPKVQDTHPFSGTTLSDITTRINKDISDKILVPYYQGNCFYRIFIADKDALLSNERVLIRRNHVYDVTVGKILGPGIANPNDIINPGEPVLPVDTYVEVQIQIEDWHLVTQTEDVKGE